VAAQAAGASGCAAAVPAKAAALLGGRRLLPTCRSLLRQLSFIQDVLLPLALLSFLCKGAGAAQVD
jgi:hypothetical protein